MTNRRPSGWQYVIAWEFRARPGMEKKFEQSYGPEGGWARLFKQNESYIGTELIRDLKMKRTYVTLDFWVSQKDYEEFRQKNPAEYKALDQEYEAMTESEREIGTFVRVARKS